MTLSQFKMYFEGTSVLRLLMPLTFSFTLAAVITLVILPWWCGKPTLCFAVKMHPFKKKKQIQPDFTKKGTRLNEMNTGSLIELIHECWFTFSLLLLVHIVKINRSWSDMSCGLSTYTRKDADALFFIGQSIIDVHGGSYLLCYNTNIWHGFEPRHLTRADAAHTITCS